jgi:hypothetical protein
MMKTAYLLVLTIIVIFVSCKKPYNPPAIASPGSYLVVEGVINAGSDSTIIKLSNTVQLSSATTVNPVLNAVVTVESDQNAVFPLTAAANGNYVSPGLNLDNSHKYRLSIITNNEQYYSDYVAVLNSPPIDSVFFSVAGNGINIYSTSHDPSNTVKYYRWDYQETWIFHSDYYSFYKSNGDIVIPRNFINDEVYQCWRSDTSSTINVGSSANLKSDIISNNPITFIASNSEKLGAKYSVINSQSAGSSSAYSILVKQYALTGEAYTFWSNLKKNTEQLGSIFDAQPSQIDGNIHSATHPTEPVIGYISVGTVASQRIFIKNQQIPSTWEPTPLYTACLLDTLYLDYLPPGGTVPINQEDEFFNYDQGLVSYKNRLIPVLAIFNLFGAIVGHTGSTPPCVDCTLRGTNVQPVFWK